jgi:hypothetical protein
MLSQFIVREVGGQGFLAEGLRRTSAGLGSVSFSFPYCHMHWNYVVFFIFLFSSFQQSCCGFRPVRRTKRLLKVVVFLTEDELLGLFAVEHGRLT